MGWNGLAATQQIGWRNIAITGQLTNVVEPRALDALSFCGLGIVNAVEITQYQLSVRPQRENRTHNASPSDFVPLVLYLRR